MAKKRANGEGSIRKRKAGRWEGRYTAGHDPNTGKAIYKNVLGKTQTEVKEKLKKAIEESKGLDIVKAGEYNGILTAEVMSFVIDTTSTEALTGVSADSSKLVCEAKGACVAGAVILSREGSNGEHLRSTTSLKIDAGVLAAAPYDDDSKEAAIASYRASAASNSDWAEESIQ